MRPALLSIGPWVFAAVLLLSVPSAARAQSIILNYKGEVLEETDEYVILKLRKADVQLIRNSPASRKSENLVSTTAKSIKQLYLEPEVINQIKAELKEELKGDVRKELHKQGVKTEFGAVKGRIVVRGVGLPECRVKLVKLTGASIFTGRKKALEFETVTDKDGKYSFRDVPTGDYQMQWLPKGATGWIRRLTEKADVVVHKGKTFYAKDVDMKRAVIEG